MNSLEAISFSAVRHSWKSILVFLSIVAVGVFFGALLSVKPALAFLALFGPFAFFMAIRNSFLWWQMMMVFLVLGASYFGPPLGSLISWGFMVLFIVGTWRYQIKHKIAVELGDVRLWICLGGFYLWSVIGTFHSLEPATSLKEISRYAFSFIFLFNYLNWMRHLDQKQVRTMIQWLEILGTIIAVICLMEAFCWLREGYTSQQLFEKDMASRIKGPNPPTFCEIGALLSGVIPISLSIFLMSRSSRTWKRFIAIGFMTLGALATGSRTAFLGTCFGIVAVIFNVAKPWIRKTILVFGLSVFIFILTFLGIKYGDPVTGVLHNLSGRNLLWTAAIHAAKDQPMFGIGPGCWQIWLQKHYTAIDFIMGDYKGNAFALSPMLLGGEAHSIFFTKLAEMGIPALVWIFGLFLCWFLTAWHAIRHLPAGWMRTIGIGSFGSVVGLFVCGFFENGPIIGKARGFDIAIVWFFFALPLVIHKIRERSQS